MATRHRLHVRPSRGQRLGAEVRRLTSADLPREHYGFDVVGVVDADRSGDSELPGIVTWPVCMIENLLLDRQAIADAVNRIDPARFLSVDEADTLLAEEAERMRIDEVRPRVQQALKPVTVRIDGTSVAEVREKLAAAQVRVAAVVPDDEELASIIAAAEAEVDSELRDGSYLERFRGKLLLHAAFGRLRLHGVSYEDFCYRLAAEGARSRRTRDLLATVFSGIDAYTAIRDEQHDAGGPTHLRTRQPCSSAASLGLPLQSGPAAHAARQHSPIDFSNTV